LRRAKLIEVWPDRRSVLIGLVALSCLLFVFVSAGSASSASASSVPTKVVVVSPTTKSGGLAAGYSVARVDIGSCIIGSLMSGGLECGAHGPNSSRHKAAAAVGYDLCWAMADSRTAACLSTLLSKRVVEVRTAELPGPVVPLSLQANLANPVAVRLTTGAVCTNYGSAASTFEHRVVRFACGKTNEWLLDPITMRGRSWSLEAAYLKSALLKEGKVEYTAGPNVTVKDAYYVGVD
jgi:hypothetical protein